MVVERRATEDTGTATFGGPVRRARPLLGTFVEIRATGPGAARAISRAFAAIERVQMRMSSHDPESELSRLNREAHRQPVKVSAALWAVLKSAQGLAAETAGAFDVTVAPRLVSTGFLPRHQPSVTAAASWKEIELLRARHVRFQRPLQVDLGGIAKGYAVDRALEALKTADSVSGCVNAGGDLRVFGAEPVSVQIRHPAQPSAAARTLLLREGSVATSARYFSTRRHRGEWVSPLLDGRTRRCCDDGWSATVIAPTAMEADALTKVVLALREAAEPVLARHGASAFLLDPRGACRTLALHSADAS